MPTSIFIFLCNLYDFRSSEESSPILHSLPTNIILLGTKFVKSILLKTTCHIDFLCLLVKGLVCVFIYLSEKRFDVTKIGFTPNFVEKVEEISVTACDISPRIESLNTHEKHYNIETVEERRLFAPNDQLNWINL